MAAEQLIADPESVRVRAADEWPMVTVAILAYNRRGAVRDTLTRLRRDLDYPEQRLEIIVVDNASRDGTAEMVQAEFPDVRVLRMPRNLGAPALNRAFANAEGDWVLILDDDSWIDGLALKLAVASAQANRADLVSFRVRSGLDPTYFFTEQYVMGMFGFWGCAWIVSGRALDVLGGYDPNIFIWGNEIEFMMRFLSAGFRHLYLPDIVAVHMKDPPPDEVEYFPYRTNLRHWAYTATKLLAASDAVRVLGRLLAMITLDLVALGPRAGGAFPQAARGVWDGLRVRQPVRPEVSALYRDNFLSFANPLGFVRRPGERLRARRDPSRIAFDARKRFDAFREQRPNYYPVESCILEVRPKRAGRRAHSGLSRC